MGYHQTPHVYEQCLKFLQGHPLPWEGKFENMALLYTKESKSASQLRNRWNTIKYLSKTFGLPDPGDHHDIKAIYNSTLDDLLDHKAKNPKKATVPPLGVIKALDNMATHENTPVTTKHAAATFRWALGTSARFDDIQHCSPHTWQETPATLEAKP
jgi:hypothetical protein